MDTILFFCHAFGLVNGENVGAFGLKLTAVVGSVFCILAIVVLLFYKEKEVLSTIKGRNDNKGE